MIGEKTGYRQPTSCLPCLYCRPRVGSEHGVDLLCRRQKTEVLKFRLQYCLLFQRSVRLFCGCPGEPRGPFGPLRDILVRDARNGFRRRGWWEGRGGRVRFSAGYPAIGSDRQPELYRLPAKRRLPGRRKLLPESLVRLHEYKVQPSKIGNSAEELGQRVVWLGARKAGADDGRIS